jgi:hypothetical protein
MDATAFREVHPILPPIQQHCLYPDVANTVPPGGIAPIEQPFSSIVPPKCQQRQNATANPPPYCEYHSAGYGAGIADGCGCQNAAHQEHNRPPPIGVRYFVHGPPQQIGGGEFHQIQQQHGPMAPIQNGGNAFYFIFLDFDQNLIEAITNLGRRYKFRKPKVSSKKWPYYVHFMKVSLKKSYNL